MFTDKEIKIFEANGFTVDGDNLQQYTPAGEDWNISGFENSEDFINYANNFDPDKEFEMWAEAKAQGKDDSIPSYRELLDDQEWKATVLQNTSDELEWEIKNVSDLQ